MYLETLLNSETLGQVTMNKKQIISDSDLLSKFHCLDMLEVSCKEAHISSTKHEFYMYS